jgi:hypothetical protein
LQHALDATLLEAVSKQVHFKTKCEGHAVVNPLLKKKPLVVAVAEHNCG